MRSKECRWPASSREPYHGVAVKVISSVSPVGDLLITCAASTAIAPFVFGSCYSDARPRDWLSLLSQYGIYSVTGIVYDIARYMSVPVGFLVATL